MSRPRNHYDNLQVARTATPGVIEASYRALKAEYEPRRAQNSEARRILGLLDRAYEVLINPAERRAHDLWIDEQERGVSRAQVPTRRTFAASESFRRFSAIARSWLPSLQRARGTSWEIAKLFGLALIGLAVLLYWVSHTSAWQTWGTPRQAPSIELAPLVDRHQLESAPIAAPSSESLVAPNGRPWPTASGYVAGYPQLARSGNCIVSVDNSDGGTSYFLKLVAVGGSSPRSVRFVYVRVGDQYEITSLRPGSYAIYFKNLTSGHVQKTPTFTLYETQSQHSEYDVTLYPVPDGKLILEDLSDADFDSLAAGDSIG